MCSALGRRPTGILLKPRQIWVTQIWGQIIKKPTVLLVHNYVYTWLSNPYLSGQLLTRLKQSTLFLCKFTVVFNHLKQVKTLTHSTMMDYVEVMKS